MASSKRALLIDTAQALFYKNGFRATGIDLILAEAGVAKKTLYHHFTSKDDLIIATLMQRDQQLLLRLKTDTQRLIPVQTCQTKLAPIMAFFDALAEWITSEQFFGCMFINGSAEYPRHDDPIHLACREHKLLMMQLIESLLVEVELSDKKSVVRQLSIIADGAIVGAHTMSESDSTRFAKIAAQAVLTHFCLNYTQ
ncbi:TetR/AcrR family transcriptional regulator [Algibacillus agarilyticus]|uniref:TetR/AcrR family transcriptional regulator n=1 Tax=Algibacillus agarilyticus TaxID=2234133 RepID=UPI000DD0B673|nr:TetR/AcrR family transcriptional regulator [Algibacillus agarilyticus]